MISPLLVEDPLSAINKMKDKALIPTKLKYSACLNDMGWRKQQQGWNCVEMPQQGVLFENYFRKLYDETANMSTFNILLVHSVN